MSSGKALRFYDGDVFDLKKQFPVSCGLIFMVFALVLVFMS